MYDTELDILLPNQKANTISIHVIELYLLLQIKKQIQYLYMRQNCIFFYQIKKTNTISMHDTE